MTKNIARNLEKIVVNSGLGRLSGQPNFEEKLKSIFNELSQLTGQKPATRSAKQSIAGFKLRAGTLVGLKVTLRKKKMEDFAKKFLNVVLPRLRDFRGIPLESIDKSGNLTIGLKEQITFPEINPDTSKVSFGMEITMVPRDRNRERALALYKELGVPFQKTNK